MRFVKRHPLIVAAVIIFLTFITTYLVIFPVFRTRELSRTNIIFYGVYSLLYALFFLALFSLVAYLFIGSRRRLGSREEIIKIEATETGRIQTEIPTLKIVVHADPNLIQALHLLRSTRKEEREQAVELLVRAIERKDKRAAVLLGLLYERGQIVPKDRDKALEIYNIAIELGSKNAYLLKAKMFEETEETVSFYNAKKAAEAGVAASLNYLGNKVFNSDTLQASHYYDLAADRGSKTALYNHALLSYRQGKTREAVWYLDQFSAS